MDKFEMSHNVHWTPVISKSYLNVTELLNLLQHFFFYYIYIFSIEILATQMFLLYTHYLSNLKFHGPKMLNNSNNVSFKKM